MQLINDLSKDIDKIINFIKETDYGKLIRDKNNLVKITEFIRKKIKDFPEKLDKISYLYQEMLILYGGISLQGKYALLKRFNTNLNKLCMISFDNDYNFTNLSIYSRKDNRNIGGKYTQITIHQLNQIVSKILLGLQCIHKLNIVHLDLKLDNIMIDENLEPYIIDFGISQIIPWSIPNIESGFIGTPGYVIPNFINNIKYKGISGIADVWAVIVMVCFILLLNTGLLWNEFYLKNKLSITSNNQFPKVHVLDELYKKMNIDKIYDSCGYHNGACENLIHLMDSYNYPKLINNENKQIYISYRSPANNPKFNLENETLYKTIGKLINYLQT